MVLVVIALVLAACTSSPGVSLKTTTVLTKPLPAIDLSATPTGWVPIAYGDIYNTRALVELAGEGIGPAPEPSLGTHFFQDLLEAQIFPLAIYLDDKQTVFNRKFFFDTPNRLAERIMVDEKLLSTLRLIKVTDYAPDAFIQIVMNDEKSLAVAFLEKGKVAKQLLNATPEIKAEDLIKE